jgi:transcription elongation GreA/GreB family factor
MSRKKYSRRERKYLQEAKQRAGEEEKKKVAQNQSRLFALLQKWEKLNKTGKTPGEELSSQQLTLLKHIHRVQRALNLPLLGVIKIGDTVTIQRDEETEAETFLLSKVEPAERSNEDVIRVDPETPVGRALIGLRYLTDKKVEVVVPTHILNEDIRYGIQILNVQ